MLRTNVGGSVLYTASAFTKSMGGAFIKSMEVETQYLPGNFGVRVIEQMPTNLSEIWRERKTVQITQVFMEDHFNLP